MVRNFHWTEGQQNILPYALLRVPLFPLTPVLRTKAPGEEAEGAVWGWQKPASVLESKQVMEAVGKREAVDIT